jgi:hypothetical protein
LSGSRFRPIGGFFHRRKGSVDTVDQRAKAIGVLFRIRIWRFVEYNRLLLRG